MRPTTTGLFTGLILGLAWTMAGFQAFVGTAVLGVVGYLIGKVVVGEIDLTRYLGASNRSNR
jgi:hypothetical protein